MCKKHFGSDRTAQRHYLAQLGSFWYEVMAGALLPDGTRRPGSPLRTSARHPGPIQEWRALYYTPDLYRGDHIDVDFMEHLHA
jgi:hypothetical protein